jgi:hypothetical protein
VQVSEMPHKVRIFAIILPLNFISVVFSATQSYNIYTLNPQTGETLHRRPEKYVSDSRLRPQVNNFLLLL